MNEAIGADRGGCRNARCVWAASGCRCGILVGQHGGYLQTAQPVRRCVRAGAQRLCRCRQGRHAGRRRDQRHVDRARPAFELPQFQELQRYEGTDSRRIRRAGHRSVDGERAREGRFADRRYAGGTCRPQAQRSDHSSRRQPGPRADPAGGGREDARPGQQRDQSDDPPRGPGAVRRQADPRDHQDPVRPLASRRQEYRLHPRHLVQRADRCRPQQRDEEPEAAGR